MASLPDPIYPEDTNPMASQKKMVFSSTQQINMYQNGQDEIPANTYLMPHDSSIPNVPNMPNIYYRNPDPNKGIRGITLSLIIGLGVLILLSILWFLYCSFEGSAAIQVGWVLLIPVALIMFPLWLALFILSILLLVRTNKTKKGQLPPTEIGGLV